MALFGDVGRAFESFVTKPVKRVVEKNPNLPADVFTLGGSFAWREGGKVAGSVVQGATGSLMQGYQALGPTGQALLGGFTGLPLPVVPPAGQGQEYANRKEDFAQQPVVVTTSTPVPQSGFNFDKLLLPVGIFMGVIVLIMAIRRK